MNQDAPVTADRLIKPGGDRWRDPDAYGAISGAEFRILREALRLEIEWLAEHWNISRRTIQRWESGDREVPNAIADRLIELDTQAADETDAMVAAARAQKRPALRTYRTDHEYRTDQPDSTMPAAWHRMLCGRVSDQIDDLAIDWAFATPVKKMTVPGWIRQGGRVVVWYDDPIAVTDRAPEWHTGNVDAITDSLFHVGGTGWFNLSSLALHDVPAADGTWRAVEIDSPTHAALRAGHHPATATARSDA